MDATVIFLIVSSLVFFLNFVHTRKPNNLPPGPRKLPFIGNIHQLAGGLPHRVLRDLAKKHGPIMHIQLAQVSVIVISSPRLVKEVLKTHDIALANRPRSLASKILFYGHTDIAFAPYGDYWRELKKTCSIQLLSAQKVRSFDVIRQQELNHFMKSISLLSNGEPIDLNEKILEMVNNVICISTFGNNCRQQQKLLKLIDAIGVVMSGFYLADLFPDYEFVPVILGSKSKLLKLSKNVDEVLEEILEDRHRCDAEAHEEEDLLEVLLVFRLSTVVEVISKFEDILMGGTETTSITIIWAMTEIMRNPNVLQKVQTEVRKAFKGKTTITETDLQSLSYMHSVIKETLRLHPASPLIAPRECREACKIDGYAIQVKQKVIINAWACATDPDYWEDPESFKPERFEKTPVDYMGTNYEFIPFGAGRRICPGIGFGIRSVEFFLAHMLYFYDWELPHGLNPVDIDMTETEGIAAGKKDHLCLIPTLYHKVVDDAFFRNLNLYNL